MMRLLLTSSAALVISGMLLVAGFVLLAPTLHPQLKNINPADSALPFIIDGNTFKPIFGTTQHYPDHLRITRLQRKRALVTTRVSKKAAEYPLIEVSLGCPHPDLELHLIWRNSVDAQKLNNIPIPLSLSGSTIVLLHGNKDWTADITEIGIDIYGELRECPLRLTQVAFLPYTPTTIVAAVYAQWTDFRKWNQASINAYTGVTRSPILYPALAVASWLMLAFLLSMTIYPLVKLSDRNKEHQRPWSARQPLTLAIIIGATGWLSLDALWLYQATLQAKETRFHFAGKNLHERKLSDWDKGTYAFVHEIKSKGLVPKGEPLTLFYETKDETTIGRLRYHLLPEYRSLRKTKLRGKRSRAIKVPGDYLITLASHAETIEKNETTLRQLFPNHELDAVHTRGRLTLYKKRDSHPMDKTNR